jgi:hypothetical protein
MDKIIDFRQHAQECRQLAARCKVPEESEMLLRMADSWEALAHVREQSLERKRKLRLQDDL